MLIVFLSLCWVSSRWYSLIVARFLCTVITCMTHAPLRCNFTTLWAHYQNWYYLPDRMVFCSWHFPQLISVLSGLFLTIFFDCCEIPVYSDDMHVNKQVWLTHAPLRCNFTTLWAHYLPDRMVPVFCCWHLPQHPYKKKTNITQCTTRYTHNFFFLSVFFTFF